MMLLVCSDFVYLNSFGKIYFLSLSEAYAPNMQSKIAQESSQFLNLNANKSPCVIEGHLWDIFGRLDLDYTSYLISIDVEVLQTGGFANEDWDIDDCKRVEAYLLILCDSRYSKAFHQVNQLSLVTKPLLIFHLS